MLQDRTDAGQKLAHFLKTFKHSDAVVLGIACGGVPVAVQIASRLRLPVGAITLGNLPIPWNTAAGFGVVATDGSVLVNEALVRELGMTDSQLAATIEDVLARVRHRHEAITDGADLDVTGRQALIVDDGMASGYTMLAAIQSTRNKKASRITVCVPIASEQTIAMAREAADEVICIEESHMLPFALKDHYHSLPDVTDEEVCRILKECPRAIHRFASSLSRGKL